MVKKLSIYDTTFNAYTQHSNSVVLICAKAREESDVLLCMEYILCKNKDYRMFVHFLTLCSGKENGQYSAHAEYRPDFLVVL